MEVIVVGLLVIVLLIAICVIGYSAMKVRKKAKDVCRKANELFNDIDTVSRYLTDVYAELEALSNTLRTIEMDVDAESNE